MSGPIEKPWRELFVGEGRSRSRCRWLQSPTKGQRPTILFFPAAGYITFRNLRPPYYNEAVAACNTLQRLTKLEGFNILVVEYPCSGEEKPTGPPRYPSALDAASAALDQVRKMPTVDSSRISLMGCSSGGHLALTLALKSRAIGKAKGIAPRPRRGCY